MRYKEFNPNKVLEQCIDLFSANGFNGTPVSEIVKASGVNRYSLYHEFGSKEGIAVGAIDLYLKRYAYPRLDAFKSSKLESESVSKLIRSFLKPYEHWSLGCFALTMATELADHHKEVAVQLKTYLTEIESTFRNWLARANTHAQSIKLLAEQLTGFYSAAMGICTVLPRDQYDNYLRKNLSTILNSIEQYA